MSVKRGQSWGTRGPLGRNAPVVGTDAELIDAITSSLPRSRSTPATGGPADRGTPEVGLMGGDLHRTLGSPRHTVAELHDGHGVRLPIDICAVELIDSSGARHTAYFCAHLIATLGRGTLFAGHTLVAMNAAFRGDANLAPRAHPGDGLIDTIEGSLRVSDRIRANRRFATGTHLPHPALITRRVREDRFEFPSPARIVFDGRGRLSARALRIECLADALTVVV